MTRSAVFELRHGCVRARFRQARGKDRHEVGVRDRGDPARIVEQAGGRGLVRDAQKNRSISLLVVGPVQADAVGRGEQLLVAEAADSTVRRLDARVWEDLVRHAAS